MEYEYDELNRVVEEKISNPLDASEDGRTITYVYDAVGNLDYKGDTVAGDTDFVYNRLNQLVRSTLGGVETVYTYDDNGSLKTRTTGDKSITYHWENDGENRLKGVDIVEGGLTTEIDYEYNEQGIRTGKKVNGVETSYLIDELQPYAQVLEEYDALGNLQNAYVYGNDLVSQSDNNETSFYHVDGLGSTRVLTDESGNIKESYNYDAYGNLIIGDASENAYLFAGEQRDIETGLDYLRARYYDLTLGRFISRDAYQGDLNDPMSQHKYQYAHANPVVNTDPSGYFSLKEALLAIDIGSNLFDAAQFIFAPMPQGAFFLLIGALDFLPPGFIKGLTKAVPENKIRLLSDAIQDFLSGTARLYPSELAANKWLKSFGHIPLFSDNNLKNIAKNIGKKKGIKIDQNRVVDIVAKSKGSDNILLLTEAKSGLSKKEIENAIGKVGARANSKFASTETLLKQIYDDTDEAALIIEDYVITYRNEVLTQMGTYKVIDGRLFDGSDLVQINGKPVIMQKVTEFFS